MIDKVVAKISELVVHETQQGLRDEGKQRILLAEWISRFVSKHQKEISGLEDKAVPETITRNIIDSWYLQDTDIPRRIIYIKTLLRLKPLVLSLEPNIDSTLRSFVIAVDEAAALEIIKDKELKELANTLPQELAQAAIGNPAVFDIAHDLLPVEQIDQVIIQYINSNPTVVPEKLDNVGYKVSNLVSIVTAMLGKMPFPDMSLTESYYDAVSKMRCGEDPTQIDKFYNQLLGLKPSNPALVKKYSGKRFFNSAQRKELKKGLK